MFGGRAAGRYYTHLSLEELEEIKAMSGFTETEVLQLEAKFEALSPENGRIGMEAFLRLPELKMPLSNKIPTALGLRGIRSLDFKAFCKSLALFHPRAAIEDKLDFIFKLYDADDDGLVSREDLKTTLRAITGDAADETIVDYAVEKVFMELGDDGDGKLSKDIFAHGIAGVDVQKMVAFTFEQD